MIARMVIGMSAFGRWRADLPLEQGYRYWRDVHGPMAARTSGLAWYRQLHLGPARDDLWPAVDGVSLTCPLDEQAHSCADLVFTPPPEEPPPPPSGPTLIDYIGADERNFVERNVIFDVASGGMHAVVDGPVPQGRLPGAAFQVCVRGAHSYVVDTLAPAWAAVDGVTRLHVVLLQPYSRESPAVPEEARYDAWIEVVAREEAVAAGLLGVAPGLAEHIRALHAYPIREQYTLVQDARPTEVGLRGWPAVETILTAGAENQRRIELLEALYGPVVRGTS